MEVSKFEKELETKRIDTLLCMYRGSWLKLSLSKSTKTQFVTKQMHELIEKEILKRFEEKNGK